MQLLHATKNIWSSIIVLGTYTEASFSSKRVRISQKHEHKQNCTFFKNWQHFVHSQNGEQKFKIYWT